LKKRRNTIRNKSFNVDQKANKHHKTALDIVKNIIILLPLLGSTWIIGIFAVNEHTTVFEWIFVILNSLQGALIFFLHIFRGPLIWKRIKKWYKKHKATKTQLTKSSQSHSTVTSIIDDTKVEATKL
jgi:latrophilin 3